MFSLTQGFNGCRMLCACCRAALGALSHQSLGCALNHSACRRLLDDGRQVSWKGQVKCRRMTWQPGMHGHCRTALLQLSCVRSFMQAFYLSRVQVNWGRWVGQAHKAHGCVIEVCVHPFTTNTNQCIWFFGIPCRVLHSFDSLKPLGAWWCQVRLFLPCTIAMQAA